MSRKSNWLLSWSHVSHCGKYDIEMYIHKSVASKYKVTKQDISNGATVTRIFDKGNDMQSYYDSLRHPPPDPGYDNARF